MDVLILQSAIRSLGLATAVWAFVRILKIRTPGTLSMIWKATLVVACLMPLLMLTMKMLLAAVPHPAVAWIPYAPAFADGQALAYPLTPPAAAGPGWSTILAVIYLVGVTVLLLRLCVGIVRSYSMRESAVRLNESWASGLDVRESAGLAIPMTFGRTILLPAEWRHWSDYKREAVLSHEAAHVERGDFYFHLVASLHCAVFWFSPLSWWLRRVLLEHAEAACDDVAIRRVHDRPTYAEVLVELAGKVASSIPVGLAMARGQTVQRRVERILQETFIPKEISMIRRLLMIAAFMPLAGFAAGSWLVQALPLPQVAPVAGQQRAGVLAGWPLETVPYIIEPAEREAFSKLANDEEREQFIEAFWLRRDPTPGTRENEFRDEYFRRIILSNERFSTVTVPGWRTDRGHVLISYGQPDEIESHPQGRPVKSEKWRYWHIEGIGRDVILEFVDVAGDSSYRLSSSAGMREKILPEQK